MNEKMLDCAHYPYIMQIIDMSGTGASFARCLAKNRVLSKQRACFGNIYNLVSCDVNGDCVM